MSPINLELRREVIAIYKELLNLGKDYPQGYSYFRPRLHGAFMANAGLRDDEAIRRAIERARFVQKGKQPNHPPPPSGPPSPPRSAADQAAHGTPRELGMRS